MPSDGTSRQSAHGARGGALSRRRRRAMKRAAGSNLDGGARPPFPFRDNREHQMNSKKYVAEAIGTFWLVLGGCGSAVLAAAFPEVGIGLLGVSLAFGLTVLTMAYAIGHISGCHLNPAVTVGLAAGGRFPAWTCVPYIIAQVVGGVIGGAVLYVIASGAPGLRRRPRASPPTATASFRRASYSLFAALV